MTTPDVVPNLQRRVLRVHRLLLLSRLAVLRSVLALCADTDGMNMHDQERQHMPANDTKCSEVADNIRR